MLLIEVPQCETLRSAGWESARRNFARERRSSWMVYADRDGQRWIAPWAVQGRILASAGHAGPGGAGHCLTVLRPIQPKQIET